MGHIIRITSFGSHHTESQRKMQTLSPSRAVRSDYQAGSVRITAMLQLFGKCCRKTHALLQFFVKRPARRPFLPKISRNAAFFRQNPGLRMASAENLTQCCKFSAAPVKNIEHCGRTEPIQPSGRNGYSKRMGMSGTKCKNTEYSGNYDIIPGLENIA